MSTPQSQLYLLVNQVQRLSDMFEADNEDESDIFEQVNAMHTFIIEVLANQQRLENQMSLIIKLLTKE